MQPVVYLIMRGVYDFTLSLSSSLTLQVADCSSLANGQWIFKR